MIGAFRCNGKRNQKLLCMVVCHSFIVLMCDITPQIIPDWVDGNVPGNMPGNVPGNVPIMCPATGGKWGKLGEIRGS